MKIKEQPISLLPDDIGIDTIKTTLAKDQIETARAILSVPPGSCVYEHSHDKESNPDSEVYIMIKINADRTGYTIEGLDVAGSNSPTGTITHGIEQSEEFRIAVAIKRGQESGLWNDYNKEDATSFLEASGFKLELSDGSLKIISAVPGHDKETVIINPDRYLVIYDSPTNRQFASLKDLKSDLEKSPDLKNTAR